MDGNFPVNRVRGTMTLRGYFDQFEDSRAGGWVLQDGDSTAPVRVHAVIDGQETGQVLANEDREDIRLVLGHITGKVGFHYQIPVEYLDGREHRLSFRLPGGLILGRLDPANPAQVQEYMTFCIVRVPKVRGSIDGLRQGQLHGWVTRTEPGSTHALGSCQVLITCDNQRVAQVRADRYRGDVATATDCDPNCGFQFAIPRAFRSASPRNFHFAVMPERIEISGSPIFISTIEDKVEATLLDAANQLENLFVDFMKLRRRINEIISQPAYDLTDYDTWARAYYPALRARVHADRLTRSKSGITPSDPLVSILVPTYRPLMTDFVAAIESVLVQTYSNWELIIVDDCSRQPELTKQIEEFCRRDKRIRSVSRKRNGNISEATNTAVSAARGEWIAFFDHDDLLVDVAIEVMMREAQRANALILYSDEDKVDQAGYFLEPNFKPDWNHRYLLGCNYVCHLLFVARESLAKAGPFNTKYNGAQDHDLILRLAEVVAADRIHHVAEVLYHWRKTPNSTATSLANKHYAVAAGVLAVADHLARRRLPAKVESINGLTLYNPVWEMSESPKVCIIIPFKDEVETTRKCLNTILTNTDYKKFEVILVDNWSLTAEAAAFVAEAERNKRVRVLRVEESFNFARINNLAAAQTKAEFLLLLNNDLFPTEKNWLRLLVNEALADPGAAAVGGRYLYPNKTIQHAGVVVGPKGLATHVNRGALANDYGFAGRIALSQELTALTAACMLVRASAFHEVGGFDETCFKVAYNDVDLCLKLRAAGHRIIYCAQMQAIHFESFSRGSDDRPENEARFFQEQQFLLERWGDHPLFLRDPAYNPHLTVDRQSFYDLTAPV